MKYLSPIPKQFVDQNGLPLSDGKVHVYISGDTQYADVYQDADGNELMPNPAKLDSNGAWLGFVTAGVPLDYVVEDKDGNVQFEYEKVVAGGEGGGGGPISAVLPLKVVGGVLTNNGSHLTCTGTNAWAEGQDTESTGAASHAEGLSTIAKVDGAHAEGNRTLAKGYYSHAEGQETVAGDLDSFDGYSAHAEGMGSYAKGSYSHAEGYYSNAYGTVSHAEGDGSHADGQRSHAEGNYTVAKGDNSHAEGYYSNAYGASSHAEGNSQTGSSSDPTKGEYAHAEGRWTYATGASSHSEGQGSNATGDASHAEGLQSLATSQGSHAEGAATADANYSHAEGAAVSRGAYSHAEGYSAQSKGDRSHAEGYQTTAHGENSHSEGYNTNAYGTSSHAEGISTHTGDALDSTKGSGAHSEGYSTEASGENSHAEGKFTEASGENSHAEGYGPKATGDNSHAEGYGTKATGYHSHAEGDVTKASGQDSHAEGYNTTASQANSHAEGSSTTASGIASHAEGYYSTASGDYSHAGGEGTRATGDSSTAIGKYNDDGTALFVVGDGTDNARSDAFKVDSNGETWVKISGVLTKITSLGGGVGIPIYATLQDAITDQASLPVGTIFETNGFYTAGDGGAARYVVSNTGTANGMDVITMATGKYALFQWSNEVTPEQLGAVGDGNTEDTTVFDYIVNYFSSVLGDMQVKRVIRGSMGKRYKVHALSIHDVCVSRCVFKGRGSTTGYGIRLGSRAIIEKCILFDFVHAIFTSDGDSAISAVVTGCTISWCGNGISLQSGTSQQKSVDNVLLENNYISRLGTLGHSTDDTPPNWDNTGCGIWLNGNWKNVNVVNNVLEYNGYAGLRLQCDRTDLEPSCTVTENYFEGNKFSAIRIMMQKRPCAVSIFGNQMTKLDTNVFYTTGIYCSSAVMSSGRIESPYGEYLGVVTSNSGSDVISVNSENLRASNVSIYPGALTAKTFQLIPAKCANSRYASRQMLHIDLYVRSPDPSFTMSVSYIDRNNATQTSNFSLTPNQHEVIEVPLIDVNLYDSTNYPVTCVVTAADGWFYIMITDMWIK